MEVNGKIHHWLFSNPSTKQVQPHSVKNTLIIFNTMWLCEAEPADVAEIITTESGSKQLFTTFAGV